MSHIHLPDGVMSAPWWIGGWALTIVLLAIVVRRIDGTQARQRVPFLGAMGALMLLTMSVPVGPLPFHLNLTVLTGVIAGPGLGFITVFMVNLLLSFLGHGGLTTVGLNTLTTGVEVVLGWFLFHRLLRGRSLTMRAVAAPTVALLISVTLTMGLVGLGSGTWAYAVPHEEDGQHSVIEAGVNPAETQSPSFTQALGSVQLWGMAGMAALSFILVLGIALETAATLIIVRFVQQVRPDILDE